MDDEPDIGLACMQLAQWCHARSVLRAEGSASDYAKRRQRRNQARLEAAAVELLQICGYSVTKK